MGGNTSKPTDYNPNDWVNTPKDQLNLQPITYPSCGLYMSLAELEASYPAIVSMSIDKQMEYSDAITRRYAKNPHFQALQRESVSHINDKILSDPNATSIGNMAFMAYHNGMDSEWGRAYTRIMDRLRAQLTQVG